MIENFKVKKVYDPAVLKMMDVSKYRWWGDTDEDREQIEALTESWYSHIGETLK